MYGSVERGLGPTFQLKPYRIVSSVHLLLRRNQGQYVCARILYLSTLLRFFQFHNRCSCWELINLEFPFFLHHLLLISNSQNQIKKRKKIDFDWKLKLTLYNKTRTNTCLLLAITVMRGDLWGHCKRSSGHYLWLVGGLIFICRL